MKWLYIFREAIYLSDIIFSLCHPLFLHPRACLFSISLNESLYPGLWPHCDFLFLCLQRPFTDLHMQIHRVIRELISTHIQRIKNMQAMVLALPWQMVFWTVRSKPWALLGVVQSHPPLQKKGKIQEGGVYLFIQI